MVLNEGVVGCRGSGFRPTGHLSPSLTSVESPRDYLAASHFMDKLPAGTGFRLSGTPGETMVSPFTCEEDEDVFFSVGSAFTIACRLDKVMSF